MSDCEKCRVLESEIDRLKQMLVLVEGWKGKDVIEFSMVGQDWEIIEHRKDKETGEIATTSRLIPQINVANLWQLIKLQCKVIGEQTKYREIVPSIIEFYHFPISIEEFNGGRNRNKYLFPFYYYPVKVLENLKFVKYGGRGQIVRLK